MARATVLKRFELSPEAAAELERRAKESGKNQTAFVEAWLTTDKPASLVENERICFEIERICFDLRADGNTLPKSSAQADVLAQAERLAELFLADSRTPASPDVPCYTIACDGCSNVWESVEAFPQTCPQCGKEIALVSPDVQTDRVSVKIGGKIERPPLDPIGDLPSVKEKRKATLKI